MILGWTAKIVQHPPKPRYVWVPKGVEPDWGKLAAHLPSPGFHVLSRRWVIERTFAWLGQNRRLSKDDEQLCESEEAWLSIAMTRLLAKRLTAASLFFRQFLIPFQSVVVVSAWESSARTRPTATHM
jgi:hypothetical protein